jgi:hypothetical protein
VQFEPSRQLKGETSGEKSTLDLPRTQATAQRCKITLACQRITTVVP